MANLSRILQLVIPSPVHLARPDQYPAISHLGGIKEFKNEDNRVVKQIGRIRVDCDSELPLLGQDVEVAGHFRGQVKDIYKGQLSWRIDV